MPLKHNGKRIKRMLCVVCIFATLGIMMPHALAEEACDSYDIPSDEYENETVLDLTITNLEQTDVLTLVMEAKSTGRQITVELYREHGFRTTVCVLPTTYTVVDIQSNVKDLSVGLKQDIYEMDTGQNVFSVKAIETEDYTIAKFLKKNALFGIMLLGCGVYLGIINWKKNRVK